MRCAHRVSPLLALGLSGLALVGCERELTISPPLDRAAIVEAQFDPTNPIPVLQIVPSPTGLAQRQDGPGLTVVPAPCELPSTKQCLAFVDGWPVSTPITLYFSGKLDMSTLSAGIKLLEVDPSATPPIPRPVSFTATVLDPRPPPPAACQDGANGSMPERTYRPEDVPPGIALILRPQTADGQPRALRPGFQYVLLVESDEAGGLRAENGSIVQPSSLFSLMNLPEAQRPVQMDGSITNALLRTNVQGLIVNALFPGKVYGELDTDQRAMVDAAVKQRGTALVGLYGFFQQVIQPLETAGLVDRKKLVLANAWTTEPPITRIAFDPTAVTPKLPFPNVQLLTLPTGPNLDDVRVNLPISPLCPNDVPAPGCDTRTSSATKAALNTLTGFSTSAPITVPVTANVDEASLQDNIVVYPVDAQGMIDGPAHPVAKVAVDSSSAAQALIAIVPLLPLAQNKTYVVGIKRGVLDTRGRPVRSEAAFDLLKSPAPLIDGSGKVLESIEPILQCSPVARTGQLATDQEVAGTAMLFEAPRPVGLAHDRWLPAFAALEGAATPIPRTDLLMAFTIRTQDITRAIDAARGPDGMPGLLDGWDAVADAQMQPRLVGPVLTVAGSSTIAEFLGVANSFCVPLCQGGATPGVPANACTDGMGNASAALRGHPVCGFAVNLVVGRLDRIEVYSMRMHDVRNGNPFTAGAFNPRHFLPPTDPNFVPPHIARSSIYVVYPTGTASAADVPVTIFQHGFGRRKEDGFQIANSLATVGHATVLMDLPFHGARATDVLRAVQQGGSTTLVPCLDVDPDDVSCAQDGTCMGGCDGAQDPSGAGFLHPNSFGARDNFRQATIDQLNLIRTIRVESNAGRPLSRLDGTRISYVGQSLGGITGGNLAAYAPELEAVVLNVPGGGLFDILENTVPQISGPVFGALAAAGSCTLVDPSNPGLGCEDTEAYRTFAGIARWVLDAGDPFATSIGVDAPHGGIAPLGSDKILIQMATPDRVVANFTTQLLGAAYGLNPADNSTNSRFQTWDFGTAPADCHGFLLAPVACGNDAVPALPGLGAICATYAAQAQAATWVSSGATTIAPRTIALPPGLPAQCPTF
jgi:pimeloyl-ACP methyl ester carboxylesterase